MHEIKAKGPRFENEEFIRLQAEKIKNLASLRGEKNIVKQTKKVDNKKLPAFDYIVDFPKREIKTVLFALWWLEHGGAEKMAVANIKAACEAGYNVVVITHQTGIPTYLESILESTNQVYMLPSLLPRWLELEAVQHIIKTHEVDCIHLHHNGFVYWNLPGLKYQFPYLKIIDSTHIIEYNQGGYVAASGRFGEYIDAHHVISKQIISYLKDKFDIPRAKMHLGYLYNEDKINTQVSGELHEKFNDIQSQCNVLFVGRSVRQKRPHLVPLIAKKLIKSCRTTQFTFNFVGEGPYLEVVKHWVKKYKLEEQFIFHPADSDVETLMEDSHFLLIPSENEGLTLVAYEAAEKNTICLSSDVGSQKEIIADEALTPRNAKETVLGMSKIICKAIKEKSFLEQLMRKQADKVNALYASPHWKEVVLSLYKK